MLVFGPSSAMPIDQGFMIYNLSSLYEGIPRLPGLIFPVTQPIYDEYAFDMWYYGYVLNDPIAFSSLMTIMISLYNTGKVYVCISDYMSDSTISLFNESFMKIIQQRYFVNCNIINDASDLEYIPKDGCDFMTSEGLQNFDQDKQRHIFEQVQNAVRTGTGGQNGYI